MEGKERAAESLRIMREGLDRLVAERANNLVCSLSWDSRRGKHRICYTYANPTGINRRDKVRRAIALLLRDDARDVYAVEQFWDRDLDTMEFWFSLRSQQKESTA